MSEILIPIAVSSQLDVSGEERIHIAHMVPVVTSPPPAPEPVEGNIVIWGVNTSTGGIAIDHTESFNSEVSGADSVSMVGWYSPEYSYVYPPNEDPQPVDLSGYEEHQLEPIALTTSSGPGTAYWWVDRSECPMDTGQWLVVLDVDGVNLLAAVIVSPGA